MKNLAIIVISIDERKDIVSLFDFYFKRNWADFDGTLFYLSNNIDFHLSFPTIQTKNEKSLNKRLLMALEKAKEEHILILCDDYFLKKKIRSNQWAKCIEEISKDNISFCEISNTFPRNRLLHLFKNVSIERRDLSLQPAIWNKHFLKKILPLFDGDPWDFEKNLWFNNELVLTNETFLIYRKNIMPFYNACFCGKRFFIIPYNVISKDIKKYKLPFELNLYPRASIKTSVHFLLVQFLIRTNFFNYRVSKTNELKSQFKNSK